VGNPCAKRLAAIAEPSMAAKVLGVDVTDLPPSGEPAEN
jgi:hypothetical protein